MGRVVVSEWQENTLNSIVTFFLLRHLDRLSLHALFYFVFFSFVRGTATRSSSSSSSNSSNGSGGSDEEGGRRFVKLIVLVVSGGRITSLDQPGRIVPRMKWTRKVFIERGIRFGNEIQNSFSSSRKNLILRFSWTPTILGRVSLGWNDRNFTEGKEKSNY